jgi:Ankyrin repeats (3 copies)
MDLRRASIRGNLSRCKQLVEKGANPQSKDADGQTPLMFAVKMGHIRVYKWLVGLGIDLNARRRWGDDAWTVAVKYGRFRAALFLHVNGAIPETKQLDHFFETPSNRAKAGTFPGRSRLDQVRNVLAAAKKKVEARRKEVVDSLEHASPTMPKGVVSIVNDMLGLNQMQ